MTLKLFLTGVTGYIGGTAFDCIYNDNKARGVECEYVLLVRDAARGEPVKAKYPEVKFVFGNIDDAEVLETAAAEADVVIDTADADNLAAATAIAKGLKAGHTVDRPGYWIHLSGTGMLTYRDVKLGREGEPPVKEDEYSDVDRIDRLVDLPEDAWHKDVDLVVLNSNSDSVKAAVVCPCTIYGIGSGPVKKVSQQVPDLIRCTLAEGFTPFIGAGLTEWDNVHIDDLGDLYVKLFNATQDAEKKNNPEIFGRKAYFFSRNGVHKWADIARLIAKETKVETKSISMADLSKLKHGNITWGRNSKGVAQRAKQYLGWEPKGVSLEAAIPEAVQVEITARAASQ